MIRKIINWFSKNDEIFEYQFSALFFDFFVEAYEDTDDGRINRIDGFHIHIDRRFGRRERLFELFKKRRREMHGHFGFHKPDSQAIPVFFSSD